MHSSPKIFCQMLIVSFSFISGAMNYDDFGAEGNPTGNPIGGGINYTRIIDPTIAHSTKFKLFNSNDGTYLNSVISTATDGDTIYINDNCNIVCNSVIDIKKKITIASGRGKTFGGTVSNGAIIRSATKNSTLIILNNASANIRITGLRIIGPIPQYGSSIGNDDGSDGIDIQGSNCEVDNCEISNWGHAGIYVREHSGTMTNIRYNYIHHNLGNGLGYGVSLDGAKALIKANIFDRNRHAIAGSGIRGTAYEACYNMILKDFYMFSFDMHYHDLSQQAGDWIKIHHNSFYNTDGYEGAVHLEGKPKVGCWVFNNWFQYKSQPMAITQRTRNPGYEVAEETDPSKFQNMFVYDNNYWYRSWGDASIDPANYPDHTYEHRSGDFNKDGRIDLVDFSNGYISVRLGNDSTGFSLSSGLVGRYPSTIEPYRFRLEDINNDKKSEIICFEPYVPNANDNFRVWATNSTATSFVNPFGSLAGQNPLGDVCIGTNGKYQDRYDFGDFDGDGTNELICYLPSGKISAWKPINNVFNGYPNYLAENGADICLIGYEFKKRYKVGDVNGDKKADLLSIEKNSQGHGIICVRLTNGDGYFHTWLDRGVDGDIWPERYRLTDVNNDGKADLVSYEYEYNGNSWMWTSTGLYFNTDKPWIALDGNYVSFTK
jgi:hypothetical protein